MTDAAPTPPFRTFVLLAALGLVALAVAAPRLLGDLVAYNYDIRIHWRWASEFSELLGAGVLYPRWMFLPNHGLGEPAFLYYSPLFFYASAALARLGPDVWAAMRLVEALALWGSGVIVHLALRRVVGASWAWLGGALAIAAPTAYVFANHANFIPFAFSVTAAVALVCASLDCRRTPGLIHAGVALSAAALVLSHILAAFMMFVTLPFLFALPFGHLRRDWAAWLGPLLRWGLSVALGLALAGVYLVPAIGALDLITNEVWIDRFPFSQAFVFPTFTYLWHGLRWPTMQWIIPLVLLGCTVMASLAAWRARPWTSGVTQLAAGLTLVSWVALFLASEAAFPLWALLEPLKRLQFPYRFLYVAQITAPMAVVLALAGVPGLRGRLRLLVAAPAAASLMLCAAFVVQLAFFDGRPQSFVVAPIAPYGGLLEYRTRGHTEVAQAWAKAGALDAECARAGLRCADLGVVAGARRWRIATDGPVRLTLPVFAFPAWALRVDGAAAAATGDAETGLIALALTPGEHEIALRWAGLASERAGVAVSLGALALLVSVFALARVRARQAMRLGRI